jgi:hypothetical protein
MSDESLAPEKGATGDESFFQPWLDYRRKRFWLLVAVLVYTLAGFFLVPALISHFTVKNIHESMERDATIADVHFNPYVLSLQVDGFTLADKDGETLVSFDTFFVNFQLSSLFRWAWTFREIRLDGSYLLHERFTVDESRLSRLLADIDRLSAGEEKEEAGDDMPRLLIAELALNEGKARFVDHVPAEGVTLAAGPVSVTVRDLNTLPDRHGEQQVQIEMENGARLSWQGDIGLRPLRSSGELSIENLTPERLLPYLRAALPIEDAQAQLSARTVYMLEQSANGSVSITLNGIESVLEGVSVTGLIPASEFFSLDRLEVSGGQLRFPDNHLSFDRIRIVDPFVDAWLGEDGMSGLMQLVPESDDAQTAGEPTPPWQLSVGEFAIEGGRAAFADRSMQPNGELGIENMELTLRDIDNADNTKMPVSLQLGITGGGRASFEGEVVLLPVPTMDGTFTADAIPVQLAQPWVEQALHLSIEGGSLACTAEVVLDADGAFRAAGTLTTDDLQVTDTAAEEPLLAWDRMAIDRYEIDSAESAARISSVRFTRPYGRIHIAEDLSTNVSGLVRESPETETASADEPAWSVMLGGIAMDDGSMDFSDFSLPLPFATKITGMDGTISTIDSNSSEPSNIGLEGQVDEFGLARIAGRMNLLDPVALTDVSVEFRNLMMTNLSPYTVQFAGRKIAEGKMDLDLLYQIDGGMLDGQNSIVLSDLVLGEEVDHPDAASLPLGLAVALLKDSNGVIDIDLPVEGDVNDPEFKIGGVIWKAVTGLITKVVTAPFKLLGSLVGAESEDFGQFQFLAGRADLTPPELEKVAQLQQALAQRPELGLEISGVYDPAVDKPALQFVRLRATVFERLGRDPTQEGDSGSMLDEDVLAVLEALFAERFPGGSLSEIQAANSSPPLDDPEGKHQLDQTAYIGSLRDRLLESEPVGPVELEALAAQRAETVADAFLAGGLDPARVSQGAVLESESEDGEWVLMELGVAIE